MGRRKEGNAQQLSFFLLSFCMCCFWIGHFIAQIVVEKINLQHRKRKFYKKIIYDLQFKHFSHNTTWMKIRKQINIPFIIFEFCMPIFNYQLNRKKCKIHFRFARVDWMPFLSAFFTAPGTGMQCRQPFGLSLVQRVAMAHYIFLLSARPYWWYYMATCGVWGDEFRCSNERHGQ